MKNTTVTIKDYTEYQSLIQFTTVYTGDETLAKGATVDPSTLKTSMTLNGKPARKLRATDQVKAAATVYEYTTKQDKLKGTVTRYAAIEDLVDKDIMKGYKQLMNDLNKQFLNGEISVDKYTKAIKDLKEAQAQF